MFDSASELCVHMVLKHDKISMEAYTGNAFTHLEMAPSDQRHHRTQLKLQAMGTHFHWTLNQEIVLSSALIGKPVGKEDYAQYCWKRCVIGTRSDYAPVATQEELEVALQHGNLQMLRNLSEDTSVLVPFNNTDYLNVPRTLKFFGDTCGRQQITAMNRRLESGAQ